MQIPKFSLRKLKKVLLTPTLLALVFFVIYSAHTIHRHNSLHSHAFDLGIYTQITYLYSQNLTPFSTLKHMPLLADHFGVVLWLISPLYGIFPSAATLLVIQAFCVSASSVFLYLIARDRLKGRVLPFLIAVSYLTSTGIVQAVNFDFHLATISVLPLSMILYFWNFKKMTLYYASLLFAVLFKEDIPIFLFGLGLYQLLYRQIKTGISTVVFAVVSFLIIKQTIMPFIWHSGGSAYIDTSVLPLNSPLDLILLTLTNPLKVFGQFFNSGVKVNTFLHLMVEYGTLPLLSAFNYLTVIPYLFLRYTSTYYQMWTLNFHHNANLQPFLAVSVILILSGKKIPGHIATILLIAGLSTVFIGPKAGFLQVFQSAIQVNTSYRTVEEIKTKVPPFAPLSAQSALVPHFANREQIFMYPETGGGEFILLNPDIETYPLSKDALNEKIAILKKSPAWELYLHKDGFYLFRRRL